MSSTTQASPSPGDFFRNGDLSGAIAAASALVKASPSSVAPRLLLVELSLFTGDLQRTETVIASLAAIDPGMELVVAEFRQLLRAEIQRRAVLDDGAAPEFLTVPGASQQHALRALAALRAGEIEDATREAAAAEDARPRLAGTLAGGDGPTAAFDDFRDIDDILCGSLEILTTTGKCYWVPADSLIEITFHAPRRARDLFWRRATVVVRDGPEGEVYVPALYHPAGASDALRLGRATDWSTAPGPVRGSGLRTFLVGNDARDILALDHLIFSAAGT
ncbi:type VI secretion system accessory protein TagJ [Acidomonas methanolica]|uniref:type VI secretion system accessory protein TagJ n=1 Tax=Acidomonas methanolica TaxID=437 RepID=UPI001C03CF47|nr:type VI secretion system accessory protein TagJ [Acidomonas methanolica]MBU2652764.1 SciE type virulence protein [Acidomonas methanolica]